MVNVMLPIVCSAALRWGTVFGLEAAPCVGGTPDDAPPPGPGAEGAAWPMFRGDRQQRGVAPGALEVPLRLLWTFEATKAITSSPVVAAGRAFVGSDDGFLYAVDLSDGSLAWKFQTEEAIEAPPMVLDGVVYVGSTDYRLYAIDARTGEQRWRFEADEKILSGVNWFHAPAGRTHIIFGCYDNILYCLNAADGSVVWKYETDNYVNGTAAIDGERIVFGGCDAVLHVVNAAEGTSVKRVALGEGCHVAGSVALADGSAYLGHYGNAFVRIDLETGEVRWTYANPRHAFFSAPAIGTDRVIFGGRDRNIHCVSRETGEAMWTFPTRRQVDSSPVLCDGKVIAGSEDGTLYILDAATGSELWSYDLGRSIISSPAVVDGVVLIGCSDGRMYAFGPAEKEERKPND